MPCSKRKYNNFSLECTINYDCKRLVDFSEYMNRSYEPDEDGDYEKFEFSECKTVVEAYDARVTNTSQEDDLPTS